MIVNWTDEALTDYFEQLEYVYNNDGPQLANKRNQQIKNCERI